MHHALFLSLVMRFYRSAQERGAKPPFNLWKGALALVHGNVASIHLVLVFHKEIMEQRLDVLHIRALFFRPIALRLMFTLQLIRRAHDYFGILTEFPTNPGACLLSF